MSVRGYGGIASPSTPCHHRSRGLCTMTQRPVHSFGLAAGPTGDPTTRHEQPESTSHTCLPPMPVGITRTHHSPPSLASPAVRATEARLSPPHAPYSHAFRARSLALTADAAVWPLCACLQPQHMADGARAWRPPSASLSKGALIHMPRRQAAT
jgi:hypothetical protein